MTTEPTSTDAAAAPVDPELQKRLDAFLDLVHKTADKKGYCAEYESVLKDTAAANPDKLEYVEAPTTTVLNYDVSVRVTLKPGQDLEAEFKAWCEANDKQYAPAIREYADGPDQYHRYDGYLTDEGKRLRRVRVQSTREYLAALVRSGDERVEIRNTFGGLGDATTEKQGRGRLVCKTA